MKNKFTKLLSCMALLCAIGMFSGCDIAKSFIDGLKPTTSESVSGSEDSTPSDTGSEDSTPSDTGSEDSTPSGTDTGSGGGTTDPTPDPVNTYTVTWLNEDGTELEVDTEVAEGTVPSYDGATPEKAGDAQYSYEFAGWNVEPSAVTGDVTYTATFTQVVNKYTVKFVNDDGTELSSAEVEYGQVPEYVGTPTKEADATYTYEFAGWDSEIVTVTGDATYTATYTGTFIEYTVTFVNDNGEVISSATYHYGDEIVAASDPSKADSEYFTYAFAGWDNEVAATVAGNVTYTATYEGILKDGINANKLSAGIGDGVVLGASEIGGGASYTKGQQNDDDDDTPSFVRQSYLALDGNYALNDYIAFDFTGKNMPEVAFFAKNYNDSMYAEGTSKQGIVVYTGITDWQGNDATITQDKTNGSFINYGHPFMIQNAADGGFTRDAFSNSALGRANLVDGTHYRVVMGFTKYVENGGIQLNWYLYNLDTNEVVEQSNMATWNFFTGSNAAVNNMTVDDLVGSIVLYGKFGTTCTIDKIHGVFEDTTIENVATGLNSDATYTVTFKDANGATLRTVEDVAFGASVSYDEALPTPEKAEDALFTYAYAWDKPFGKITADTTYTLTAVPTPKSGFTTNNVTANGDVITLGAGNIGAGANYIKGQNAGGSITQAYLALDGDYGFDNYVVFDFTGKNMPEIMFFAKNYDASMYYSEGKQGVVVASGITLWNGTIGTAQTNNTKVGVSGPFGAYYEGAAAPYGGNMMSDFAAQLARANLVDGTQYRVIMGIAKAADSRAFTLRYLLYNVTDNVIVEDVTQTTWNFFTGSDAAVGNMTLDGLAGSIVLYGKFGATCTIDKLYGVESGTYADIVAKYTTAN